MLGGYVSSVICRRLSLSDDALMGKWIHVVGHAVSNLVGHQPAGGARVPELLTCTTTALVMLVDVVALDETHIYIYIEKGDRRADSAEAVDTMANSSDASGRIDADDENRPMDPLSKALYRAR